MIVFYWIGVPCRWIYLSVRVTNPEVLSPPCRMIPLFLIRAHDDNNYHYTSDGSCQSVYHGNFSKPLNRYIVMHVVEVLCRLPKLFGIWAWWILINFDIFNNGILNWNIYKRKMVLLYFNCFFFFYYYCANGLLNIKNRYKKIKKIKIYSCCRILLINKNRLAIVILFHQAIKLHFFYSITAIALKYFIIFVNSFIICILIIW